MKTIKALEFGSDVSFFHSLSQTEQMLILAALYFGTVSLITFLAFAMDKQKATRGEWRISEANLFFLAFIGGAFGAKLGQKLFRHKTKKEPFRSNLQLAVIFNIFIYFIALPTVLILR